MPALLNDYFEILGPCVEMIQARQLAPLIMQIRLFPDQRARFDTRLDEAEKTEFYDYKPYGLGYARASILGDVLDLDATDACIISYGCTERDERMELSKHPQPLPFELID